MRNAECWILAGWIGFDVLMLLVAIAFFAWRNQPW